MGIESKLGKLAAEVPRTAFAIPRTLARLVLQDRPSLEERHDAAREDYHEQTFRMLSDLFLYANNRRIREEPCAVDPEAVRVVLEQVSREMNPSAAYLDPHAQSVIDHVLVESMVPDEQPAPDVQLPQE